MNLRKLSSLFAAMIGLLLMATLALPAYALDYSQIAPQGKVLGDSTNGFYPYPTGTLVNDSGTVYFISGTTKVPFTNWQAFIGLGYKAKNIVDGDLTNYTPSASYSINTSNATHPWGSWLIYKGTVYYSTQDGLIGVPSSQSFTSNGGDWTYIVKANSYDVAVLNSNPNLQPLAVNDSRITTTPTYGFGNTPTSPTTTVTNPTLNTTPVPTNVLTMPTNTTSGSIRVGQLVNVNGTVDLVGQNGLYAFPDIATFNSWGYSFSNVLPANSAEAALPQLGVVYARVAGCDTLADEINHICPSSTSATATGAPVLSVTLDPSSPAPTTIVPGTTDVTVAVFKITSSGSDSPVGGFRFINYGPDCSFTNLKLFDASTGVQIGSTVLSATQQESDYCYVDFSNLNLDIQANNSETVALKLTVPSNGTLGTFTFGMAGFTVSPNASGQTPTTPFSVFGNTMTIAASSATLPVTPTISVTPPKGGESWSIGSQQTIQWTSSNIKQVTINLYKSGSLYTSITGNGYAIGNQNSYSWTIPSSLPVGSDYQIQVNDANSGASAISAQDFSIVAATNNPAPTSSVVLNSSLNSAFAGGTIAQGSTGQRIGSYLINNASSQSASLSNIFFEIDSALYGGQPVFQNIVVKVNGAQFGQTLASLSSLGGYTFTANTPIMIPANTSVTVDLYADVPVNTSDPSYINTATDLANCAGTGTTATGQGGCNAVGGQSFTLTGTGNGATTQSGLSATINSAFVGGSVTTGTTGQEIGSYLITASPTQGINLSNINIVEQPNGGNITFQNLTVKINGTQFGQVVANPVSYQIYPFYGSVSIPANGNVTVNIYADVPSSNSASSALDLATEINACAGTGATNSAATFCSLTYGQNITVSGSGSGSATPAVVTVTSNPSFAGGAVSVNTPGAHVGSYILTAPAQGANLSGITIQFAGSQSSFANLVVKVNGNSFGYSQNPGSSNTFSASSPVLIPANGTATVDVYADVSNIASGTLSPATIFSGCTGSGASNSAAISCNSVNGQTITINPNTTPTFSEGLEAVSPPAQNVTGGTTNQPAATINVTAFGSSVTIQKMIFAVNNYTSSSVPVTAITVGGVTAAVVGSTATVTGLNISVPNGGNGTNIPITMNLTPVGINGIPGNQSFNISLSQFTYLSSSSQVANYSIGYGSIGSNTFTLVGP